MSDNGKPPLAFPAASSIPIVGLPFTLEGWFVQVLITCKCDQPKPVLIVGQPGKAMGQCASCQKIYELHAMGMDPQTKQPQFQIAMMTAQQAVDAAVPTS